MLQFSHLVLGAFQKQPPCNQQLIHHNWWVQLPWPSLSLPIWWPAEDWWADHHRVKEDTIFAPTLWHLKFVYDLLDDICPLFFSQAPPCWMMVWKIISEAWYLNINFPRSSTITYRLSVSCVDLLRFYLLQPFTNSMTLLCAKYWFCISLSEVTESPLLV